MALALKAGRREEGGELAACALEIPLVPAAGRGFWILLSADSCS